MSDANMSDVRHSRLKYCLICMFDYLTFLFVNFLLFWRTKVTESISNFQTDYIQMILQRSKCVASRPKLQVIASTTQFYTGYSLSDAFLFFFTLENLHFHTPFQRYNKMTSLVVEHLEKLPGDQRLQVGYGLLVVVFLFGLNPFVIMIVTCRGKYRNRFANRLVSVYTLAGPTTYHHQVQSWNFSFRLLSCEWQAIVDICCPYIE